MVTLQSSRSVQSSQAAMARLGWVFADAWTIAVRDLQHWRQQPGIVIFNWVFPILIVLMFGLLFGGAIVVPEGTSYFEFLMPGMFAVTMLFGLETTMMAVTTDAAKGVTDRFRSMPMSASAVVLGRCIADMLNSIVGLVILAVTGLVLGWRWHGSVGAAFAAFGLLLLLRFALLWVGIFMGLNAKGPESVATIQVLVWPVSFLSNVFVDPATMPAWLGAIAQWNPLSVTSSAARTLFENAGTSWAAENAVLLAILMPLVITAVFLPLSVRKFRHLNQ